VDLVLLAELCDAIFDGDPADRDVEPWLLAIVDSGEDLAFHLYGPVSHEELADWVVPPEGCRALVLRCGGWMSPAAEGATDRVPEHLRPSRHPDRRRIHNTTLIGNDFEIVSVLRVAGNERQTLTGECHGRVPEALRACWSRRISSEAA
jgi:hypothetical protein